MAKGKRRREGPYNKITKEKRRRRDGPYNYKMTKEKEKTDDSRHGRGRRHIPLGLITEILLRLPIKSVARFKSVSLSWYRLINDLVFIKLHLRRSLEANPDTYLVETLEETQRLHSFKVVRVAHQQPPHNYHYEVAEYIHPRNLIRKDRRYRHLANSVFPRVIGSGNGLICFTSASFHSRADRKYPTENIDVFLYNPVTLDLRRLPPLNPDPTKSVVPSVVAFGYDSVSDDYKVLTSFFIDDDDEDTTSMQRDRQRSSSLLYSLKKDAWEHDIPNPPTNLRLFVTTLPPVMANNSLHWMHNARSAAKRGIMCFDLFAQRYYHIPHPDADEGGFDDDDDYYYSELAVLRGQLCVITYKLDIWMLNEQRHDYHDDDINHNNSAYWTRIFHHQLGLLNNYPDYPNRRYTMHFSCSKDGKSIILAFCDVEDLQDFVLYCDLESKEAREIEVTDLHDLRSIIAIHPWVESLVPLH